VRWLAGLVLTAAVLAAPARAQEVNASEPSDVSVTIYRDPNRNGGTLQLDALGGFAVVSETRRVTIPAGRSKLRFVGVVDGIIPESAMISGLPGGVIEKNRDAALLSPATLLRAVQGKQVYLKRTNRDTGKVVQVPVTVISASEEGVVFQSAGGKEALRCSGYPETFTYGVDTSGLSARPVLSVVTKTSRPVTVEVKLTYLAQGFDWNASYTAQVDPEAKQMDVGGWITLANGNSVSLENAQVQIVAGGLRREAFRRLVDGSPQAVARCWPMQRTHQIPRKPEQPYELVQPWMGYEDVPVEVDALDEQIIVTARKVNGGVMMAPAPVMAAAPPPLPPPPEQLGDLKLYRIPYRTTVAANQMKQTRLLEREGVGFARIHALLLAAMDPNVSDYLNEKVGQDWEVSHPVTILRTKNDKENQLGLPLPSGAFLIQQEHAGRTMLLGEPALRDTAEDEKVELALGAASDVTIERRTRSRSKRKQNQEVRLSNAGTEAISLELRFNTWGSIRLEDADAPLGKEDGQPIFKLELPPGSSRTLRYTVRWN
jgi:hypothetical protein